jgi:hypothetical protein
MNELEPIFMPLAAPPLPAGPPPNRLGYVGDRLANSLARAFGLPPQREPDPRAANYGAPFGVRTVAPGVQLGTNPRNYALDAGDLIAGFSPVAAVMDAAGQHQAARERSRAGDYLGALEATGMGILAMAGVVPPGKAPAAVAREAALLKRATDAARKAGLAVDEASRMQRRAAGGYTAGLWRGGGGPESGRYFTPDKDWAAHFAAKYGETGDLREYAIRMGREFDARQAYSAAELKPITNAVAKVNRKFAQQLVEHVGDWKGGMPGNFLFYLLKQNLDDPFSPFARAGYDSINAGSEVVALRRARGQVRDVNKAMFNPALSNSRNPFATVLPPALVGLLYPTLLSEERPR